MPPAARYIEQVSSGSGNDPASGSWTIPAYWKPDDVAVFFLYSRTSTYQISDPPTGITTKVNNSGNGRLYVGYRTLQSGDTNTFSWSRSVSAAGSDTFWWAVLYRDVDGTGDPFEATSGTPRTETSATPNPDSVSVSSIGALAVTVIGVQNDTSTTPPSGYAQQYSQSSVAGSDGSAAVAHKINLGAGTEDPGTWSITSNACVTWTGVLKPKQIASGVTFLGRGAVVSTTLGQITLALPHARLRGDLMVALTTGGGTHDLPSGWTSFSGSPQASPSGNRIACAWRIHQSGDAGPTTTGGGGNGSGVIFLFENVDIRSPVNVSVGSREDTSDTSLATSSVTTTVDNTLVIALVGRSGDNSSAQFSGWSGTSLSGVEELEDWGFALGTGGGAALAVGTAGAAGTYGGFSATLGLNANKQWVIAALRSGRGPSVGSVRAVSQAVSRSSVR